MCPGTLAIVAVAASAAGSIQSGFAQANADNYRAAVARNNAQIAKQNAGYAAAAGGEQVRQQSEKAAQQGANVRASLAANGVDVNSGSAADVQTSQRQIGALDTETVARRAAQSVYGYQTQQSNYESDAAMEASKASGDIAGGFLKGVSTIASAGASGSLPTSFSWMGGHPTNASGEFNAGGGDLSLDSSLADLYGEG